MPAEESSESAANTVNVGGLGKTPTNAMQVFRGAVIGHYQLVELIGEGGMGEVWLAEQQEPCRGAWR